MESSKVWRARCRGIAAGRVGYYYAWRGGPRVEGEPGSTEFISSFHRLRLGRPNYNKSRQCVICSTAFSSNIAGKLTCDEECARARRNQRDSLSLSRSEMRRASKRDFHRKWRKNNPDKVKAYAAASGKRLQSRPPKLRNCEVCRLELAPGCRALTCSPLCRFIRRPPKSYYVPRTRNCIICGTPFSGRGASKTCSDAHQQEHHILRRREDRRRRRQLAAAASAALLEMKILKRPAGMSKNQRRQWNDLALTAARSLNLIEGATI